MYIILSYDVNAMKCNKLMKLLKKYLFHVQNSVFEGYISDRNYKELIDKIKLIADENNDHIIIYKINTEKVITKEYINYNPYNFIIIE